MPNSTDRPPIVIGLLFEKYVSHKFIRSFMQMHRSRQDIVAQTDMVRTDIARNQVVDVLMEEKQCTHVLFLDSDQVFLPDTPEILLAHHLPVVGCLIFRRQHPYHPHMYKWSYEVLTTTGEPMMETILEWEKGSLVKCDVAGVGGMLIAREVFEQIPRPWFEFSGPSDTEDVNFARKLTKLGIPVYCDTGCESGHLAEMAVGSEQFYLTKAIAEGKVSTKIPGGDDAHL